jgi:hypothetical protein
LTYVWKPPAFREIRNLNQFAREINQAAGPAILAVRMPQRFTLEDAESLLPRLIPLVTRMQQLKAAYDELLHSVAALAGNVRTNGHPRPENPDARQQLEATSTELNGVLEQITSHGCEVKDLSLGLLDFLSLQDGREVYLCWQAGEPRIEWWHEVNTGFASRQPLERPGS